MADKKFLDDDVFKYDEDESDGLISDSTESKSHQEEETVIVKEEVQQKEPVRSKPILETKKEDVPKTVKTPKKAKKRQLKQDIAVKKLISISQKNIKVVEILKNLPKDYPSDSEYICQAIIEKYERETEFKNTDIKSLVKDALEELVGEKYIIMKGSSDIQVASSPVNMPTAPIIQQSSINKVISAQEEDEKESLLLGIIDDMDDD